MKRCLALLIMLSMASAIAADGVMTNIVKTIAGSTPAKERLKTFGSVAFSVGGAVYLLASYKENQKFDKIKGEYIYEKSSDQNQRMMSAGRIEGQFNLWRGIRYFSTGSIIAGSFLLGMSLEDSFNLI